jgi:FkbM family methyltransferase
MKQRITFVCIALFVIPLLSYDIIIEDETTHELGYNVHSQHDLNGEKDLLDEYLQPGFCVIDGGANIGAWSQTALSIQPSLNILAFEPVPSVYEICKKNLFNTSARAINLALSNEEGKREFFFLYGKTPEEMQGSSCHFQPSLGTPDACIAVEQTTIDAFCRREKIRSIDFLKLDVEGHEFLALRGATRLLKKGAIKAVQFEYGYTFSGSKTTLKRVYQLLNSYGYLLFRIMPGGCIFLPSWSDTLENFQYSNFFAVLPSALNATWHAALDHQKSSTPTS